MPVWNAYAGPVSDAGAGRARRARLGGLYAIVGGAEPVAQAAAAVEGGARVIQVRMKDAPSGAVLDAARRVVALAAGRALVLVNDRADLALLAGADGVHLGDDDLPVTDARALLGEGLLVGRTTRTLEEARAALLAGADHVGFGPIFGTRSKALAVPPRGLDVLREVASGLGAPVVAIGGIDAATIAEVARAGAACAAVIDAIFGAGDPAANAARLAAAFEAGRASGRGEGAP
jgi:thiamine-phosphate pyrophosphorylase